MAKVFGDAGLTFQAVRRRLEAGIAFQVLTLSVAYPAPDEIIDNIDEKELQYNFVSAMLDH